MKKCPQSIRGSFPLPDAPRLAARPFVVLQRQLNPAGLDAIGFRKGLHTGLHIQVPRWIPPHWIPRCVLFVFPPASFYESSHKPPRTCRPPSLPSSDDGTCEFAFTFCVHGRRCPRARMYRIASSRSSGGPEQLLCFLILAFLILAFLPEEITGVASRLVSEMRERPPTRVRSMSPSALCQPAVKRGEDQSRRR